MKKTHLIAAVFALMLQAKSFAQSIKLNTAEDPGSAMLEVSSSRKGILIPNISLKGSTDATTIALPAVSLLVYNTAIVSDITPGYYYNSGTKGSPFWTRLLTSGTVVGAMGPQGEKGDDGGTGSQGLTGNDGSQGTTGATGIQGSVGEKGDTGNVGLTGAVGVAGIKGIQGDTGTQGSTGAKGDTGNVGLTGAVGVAGIQGIQGDTGTQGSTGAKGDTGNVGLTGTVGVAGSQGIQGDTGTQGAAGAKGDTGNVGLTGTVGVAGSQGIQGETGTQGAAGAKGDTGNVGLTGTVGVAGSQGIQGVQGETGTQGATGASGIAASSAFFADLSTDQTLEGNKTFAEPIVADISGNAVTVTTNANLTGEVTSVGNATLIANGVVSNLNLDKANIPLSGFGAAVADVNLGANKLTEIADPVSAQDAASKKYVDNASIINSVTEGDTTTTTSNQNLLVSGMTLTPALGTYVVLFNGQMSSDQAFSTTQGDQDVLIIYNDLMAATGGVSHPVAFGSETFLPGVYDVVGALSISGTLTLDGLGDPNSLFIIRTTGAITTSVNTTLVLSNQAVASNVFWVSEGAISTADPTIMKGTLFANQAAVALGANTNLEGRIFALNGALTMGASSSLTIPTGESNLGLGVLSSFAMYTSVGAVSDCIDCILTGDVGTGLGVISGFANLVGTVYPAGSVAANPSKSTYGIFKNGVEVLHSSRTIRTLNAQVSLQGLVSVTVENTPIEIRWKVDTGNAKIGARNLSLIRSSL